MPRVTASEAHFRGWIHRTRGNRERSEAIMSIAAPADGESIALLDARWSQRFAIDSMQIWCKWPRERFRCGVDRSTHEPSL